MWFCIKVYFYSIYLWCYQLSVRFSSAAPWLPEECTTGVAYWQHSHLVRVPPDETEVVGQFIPFMDPCAAEGPHHHTHMFEFRSSWRTRRYIRVCLCCQAASPGVALGSPSPYCPRRVHAGGTCPSLWRNTHTRQAQCSPGGYPAAGAPPRVLTGQTMLLSQRVPGQFTEQVAQTACRFVCPDLGPR